LPTTTNTVKSASEIEKEREAQKEEEQAVLDDEMRKRRDRVKAWQDEKNKRIAAEAASLNPTTNAPSRPEIQSVDGMTADRVGSTSGIAMVVLRDAAEDSADAAWTLEDDDDDDKGIENTVIDESDMVLPSTLLSSDPSNQGSLLLGSGPGEGGAVFESVNPSGGIIQLKSKRDRASSISIIAIGSPKVSSADSSDKSDTGSASAVLDLRSVKQKSKSGTEGELLLTRVSSSPKVGASATLPSSFTLSSAESKVDGYDPLDDFMSSLYGEGDVEEQSLADPTKHIKRGTAPPRKAADVVKNGMPHAPSSSGSGSSSAATVEQVDADTGGEEEEMSDPMAADDSTTDDDYDEYSYLAGDNPRVNPFGSNFITLEQIMGNKSQRSPLRAGSSSSGGGRGYRNDYSNSGWESDSAPPSPMNSSGSKGGAAKGREGETDEQREEREDRDRREFIEGIRAARAAEDVVRERSKQKDEAAEKSKEQLGRVFASEGDVMDETDIEEKKKSALEILEESKKGKELKPVDHKTVDYIPFRKNLYIVPKVLSKLSEADLAEKREDLQIKVRGKGCPAPVDTWGQCGLSERVLGVIEKLNLTAPFAIQAQAIPAIMCGRDLIGVAKTGSGKTLAFLLPMFRHIMDQPPLRCVSCDHCLLCSYGYKRLSANLVILYVLYPVPCPRPFTHLFSITHMYRTYPPSYPNHPRDQEGPIGLVMAPARELAFQIFNEAKKFSKALGIRVACVYGEFASGRDVEGKVQGREGRGLV
jgi:DEAD/DEAH box helicase